MPMPRFLRTRKKSCRERMKEILKGESKEDEEKEEKEKKFMRSVEG